LLLANLTEENSYVIETQLKNLIACSVYYHWLDYTLYMQCNESVNGDIDELEGIFCSFSTQKIENSELEAAVTTTLGFWIREKLSSGNRKTSLLTEPQFLIVQISQPSLLR
jgi:hypothetical protein